jgi:anti-anti-sigma regulatory factor
MAVRAGKTVPTGFGANRTALGRSTDIKPHFGLLDLETSSQLYPLVADELLRAPAQLVLELSNLASVDNAVVDALVSASTVAGESDISFCLVASHASPVVATLAEAGLIERFEVFPTVCAATGDR